MDAASEHAVDIFGGDKRKWQFTILWEEKVMRSPALDYVGPSQQSRVMQKDIVE